MDNEQKYKEKYKAALERARELSKTVTGANYEFIFPELKESEDERIKREIIAYINELADLKNEKIPTKWLAWLEKQEEPKDKGEISDGYHTFNELYRYRMLYNAAFFNLLPKELVHKSKKHHDGKECFGGEWFIVMANLPTGQISNHYELKDWDLFQIPEKNVADEWDGHTPQDAADRLYKYLLEKQGEQTTDKVEPKFKVGDWLQYRHAEPFLVEEITKQGYCNGNSCLPFGWEDEMHLWTIQDAKDGDVLYYHCSSTDFSLIGIFKRVAPKYELYGGTYRNHVQYGGIGGIENHTLQVALSNNDLHHCGTIACPATKEQREFLFQKMKEAGYEWDADKKKLSKQPLKITPKFCVGQVITDDNGTWYQITNIKCLDDWYYEVYDMCEGDTHLGLCSIIDEKFRENRFVSEIKKMIRD